MSPLTPEEIAQRKLAIYEKIPVRRRKFIDKMGYENWDPFMEPFDPIDIRKDMTGRTAQELVSEFMQFTGKGDQADYLQTVQELAVLLVHNSERVRPMFDFCLWYKDVMARSGVSFESRSGVARSGG